jgi:hypothetical protein
MSCDSTSVSVYFYLNSETITKRKIKKTDKIKEGDWDNYLRDNEFRFSYWSWAHLSWFIYIIQSHQCERKNWKVKKLTDYNIFAN